MSDARDPRTDPRPGDVLEFDGGTIRVTLITTNTVQYKVTTKAAIEFRNWDFFMAGARVVARGAGAGEPS